MQLVRLRSAGSEAGAVFSGAERSTGREGGTVSPKAKKSRLNAVVRAG